MAHRNVTRVKKQEVHFHFDHQKAGAKYLSKTKCIEMTYLGLTNFEII